MLSWFFNINTTIIYQPWLRRIVPSQITENNERENRMSDLVKINEKLFSSLTDIESYFLRK